MIRLMERILPGSPATTAVVYTKAELRSSVVVGQLTQTGKTHTTTREQNRRMADMLGGPGASSRSLVSLLSREKTGLSPLFVPPTRGQKLLRWAYNP